MHHLALDYRGERAIRRLPLPPPRGEGGAQRRVGGWQATRTTRAILIQDPPDRSNHPLEDAQYVGGREATCAIPFPRQNRIATQIVASQFGFAVLDAIDLDREPPDVADEIEEIVLKRRLTAEVEARAGDGGFLGYRGLSDAGLFSATAPAGESRHPPAAGEGEPIRRSTSVAKSSSIKAPANGKN